MLFHVAEQLQVIKKTEIFVVDHECFGQVRRQFIPLQQDCGNPERAENVNDRQADRPRTNDQDIGIFGSAPVGSRNRLDEFADLIKRQLIIH